MAVVITVLKADKKLEKLANLLEETSQKSISQIEKKLPLNNLDILFYASKRNVIPHLGIGGSTKTSSFITIPIDPSFKNIEKSIKTILPKTIAHEVYHAVKNYSYEDKRTLFESMINEGLADHFELEIFGGEVGAWDKALSKKDLSLFLEKSKPYWESKEYDHAAWFFGSQKENIPKWAGYSLGFHLVENYLKAIRKLMFLG